MPRPTTGIRPNRVLRANAGWIIAATVAALVGAWFLSGAIKPKYVSRASVVLEPRVTANTTPVSPAMGTEKQLVSSGVVIDRAADSLGLTSEELEKHLDVAVPPDANVLVISCDFGDPVRARQCADRVASNYVAYRGVAAESSSGVSSSSSSSSSSSGGAIKATVVTRATLPTHPENNPRALTMVIGGVLGVLLGLGGAFVRELLSSRLSGIDDLAARTGLPVAGLLPAVPRIGGRVRAEQVVRSAPGSATAEGYRHLRARLATRLERPEKAAVLVTSAQAGEGRSTVAANLATALARSGLAVILVDADSLHPGQDVLFGVDPSLGLPALLAGDASVDAVAQETSVSGLRVVAGGQSVEFADHLLTTQNLARVVGDLRAAADVVVFDAAAALEAAEVVGLAALCDAVLLVAHARRSTKEPVAVAAAQLAELDVPVLAVATAVPGWWGAPTLARGRAGAGRSAVAGAHRHVRTGGWHPGLPRVSAPAAVAASGHDGATGDASAEATAPVPAAPGPRVPAPKPSPSSRPGGKPASVRGALSNPAAASTAPIPLGNVRNEAGPRPVALKAAIHPDRPKGDASGT